MSGPKSAFTILLTALACAGMFAQQSPQLNDGEPHGDPPFLLEDGWKPLLNGKDVSGWHAQDGGKHDWFATKAIRWDPLVSPERLQAIPEPGDRILNGNGRTSNLVTDEKFGDIELYLEFMLSKGSNSGVYVQGLYEVQIFDSYGSPSQVGKHDGGAIYQRWINEQGVGGSAPKVNASLAPGQWQSYQIWFQAPRFDAGGKKIANAKFLRVLYNGQLVQQNVEVEGPTRAPMPIDEAPLNPLMLQGDHGPVAFRNIYWRPLRPIVTR